MINDASVSAPVTVIIAARDARDTVAGAISSALVQGELLHEVIVVDDGSRDGTAEEIQRVAADDASRRVKVLTHPGRGNRGVAASRNLAVRAAGAELIAFLDADDELAEGSLSTRASALRDHPEASIVYGLAQTVGGDPLSREVVGAGIEGAPRSLLPWLAYENPLPLSTVLVRRGVLGDHPFPEGLEYQFEDWLAWLAIAAAGHKILFLNSVLATYFVGPGTWTSRLSDSGRRLMQLVDEASALRARPGMLPFQVLRDAARYRAAVILVEALGQVRRGRLKNARQRLRLASQAAGSAIEVLHAATSWVPRIRLHSWLRRPGTPAERWIGTLTLT